MIASYREDFDYHVIKSFSRHGKPNESWGRKTIGSKSEMIRQPVIEREVYYFSFPKNVNGKPVVRRGRKTIGSSKEDSQVPRERSL
jgi:hypothetical protein